MPLEAAYILPHPPLAVPEVGRGSEQRISDTIAGYENVARRIARHAPSAIIFISPHTAHYDDWIFLAAGDEAEGDFAQFGAPLVELDLSYDAELRESIITCANHKRRMAGYVSPYSRRLDHGVLVPLYFIQKEYPASRYRAVSIGGSGLPNKDLLDFGDCIAQVSYDYPGKVVVVVSGDLSHKLTEDGPYGYDPAGPKFDEEFGRVVLSGDPMGFAKIDPAISAPAAECGLSGFVMLAGIVTKTKELEHVSFSSELLSLEGPFGVGYGVAAFEKRQEVAS